MKFYNYHRSTLSSRLRAPYDALLEKMRHAEEHIDLPYGIGDVNLVEMVTYDHPEIFYYQPYHRFTKTPFHTHIDMEFAIPKDDAKAMIGIMRDKIRSEFGPLRDKSDYEKVMTVVEWFEGNVRYDLTHPDCYTMAGPLMRGQGVCEGIALLMTFLLGYLDLDVFMMVGTVKHDGNDENHAWNAVKVEGRWCYLDMTNSIDGGKSYILVPEKRLSNAYTFIPPKGLSFNDESLDYFVRYHRSFLTPKDAAAYLSRALKSEKKVPLRLEVKDAVDHGEEILDAVEGIYGSIGWLFRAETQTYLFEKK